MKAGRLREVVQFQRPVVTGSGATRTVTWTDDFTTRAEVRRETELIARFTIRYRSGITPASHRIVWEAKLWYITTAVHDLKKRFITIDADATPLVESTDLTDTTTEYIDAVPIVRPDV